MKTTRYHLRSVRMWGRQDNGKEIIPQRGEDCHLERHHCSHQLGAGEDPWWPRCGHLMHIEFYYARCVHCFIIKSQKSLLIVVGAKRFINRNPSSDFVKCPNIFFFILFLLRWQSTFLHQIFSSSPFSLARDQIWPVLPVIFISVLLNSINNICGNVSFISSFQDKCNS